MGSMPWWRQSRRSISKPFGDEKSRRLLRPRLKLRLLNLRATSGAEGRVGKSVCAERSRQRLRRFEGRQCIKYRRSQLNPRLSLWFRSSPNALTYPDPSTKPDVNNAAYDLSARNVLALI